MDIKLGSLFSGIGGFELGLERAIPGLKTVWQCEQDRFCQSILKKHWPDTIIYDDVRNINNQVESIDILCGGFPCQDISLAGTRKGINENTRSGLWWEMHRIISILGPRIAIMENVPGITTLGGCDVIGSLASIGYDCEWTVISAAQCGAPHIRKRWFCVAYPHSLRSHQKTFGGTDQTTDNRTQTQPGGQKIPTQSNLSRDNTATQSDFTMEQIRKSQNRVNVRDSGLYSNGDIKTGSHWEGCDVKPLICGMDDGISTGLDRTTRRNYNNRLKALGNAIVPQCSQWVGEQIVKSGLLDDLLEK